ncbi:hypothetical protein SSAG_01794 [Streptomyces sp. Mg1]|nr:hypothetical protein SSAG_01794 [Streptomyces sp. Mg1]
MDFLRHSNGDPNSGGSPGAAAARHRARRRHLPQLDAGPRETVARPRITVGSLPG